MGEKINIWGKPNCQLPNGRLCTACCQRFTISEFNSPAGKLCEYADPNGGGCRILTQPDLSYLRDLRNQRCGPYYCGDESNKTEISLLVLTAFNLGQVTLDEIPK
jgi:hypothetical protein